MLHTFRPRADDPEEQANRFAGALLVPQVRAESCISERKSLTEYARMKATWGRSIQALILRGAALGLIGDTRKRSLFVQLSAKRWRKNEVVIVGHEDPPLLWALLPRRYGQQPYQAAEDLGDTSHRAAVNRTHANGPVEQTHQASHGIGSPHQ